MFHLTRVGLSLEGLHEHFGHCGGHCFCQLLERSAYTAAAAAGAIRGVGRARPDGVVVRRTYRGLRAYDLP